MKRRSSDQSGRSRADSSAARARAGASRRDFLKGFGTAAFAGAVPFATGLAHLGRTASTAAPLNISARPQEAYQRRLSAAQEDRKVPVPRHKGNGDEALYSTGIANFTKGFPHNDLGEVDPGAYASYLAAVKTGKRSDFDNLAMGGNVPLVDPQAGLCFDLESVDVSQNAIPAAFALASPGRAAEAVESYWLALARDVPFSQYDSDPTAQAAVAELSSLAGAFMAPPYSDGNVTGATLFRGFTASDLVGPYVSQLFLQPFSYGVIPFRGYLTDLPLSAGGSDYMTDSASWLQVQNGQSPFASEHPDPQLRYPRSGRDLAAYVHNDVLFQEYLNAALMLMTMHAPLNSGNPYSSLKSETGFITFGFPQVQVLVAEVTARALKNAWFQKWFVHRLLRPEEFGGLVHFTLTGQSNYPLDSSVLDSAAVKAAFSRNGAYLLPSSYPEGCPQHPSYPSGHATVAGACVTVLKWFFSESFVIPNPLAATDDGTALVPYTGADAGQITVGGELNKLAANVGIGRNFAGIHWRADYQQGLLLGEAVAISLLRDQEHIFHESFKGFTFTRFDGTPITV